LKGERIFFLHVSRLFSELRGSTLLINAAGSFGLRISAAGLGFLSGILLARLLGPKELGIYAIAMASINLAATGSTLGLPSLVIREVAKYKARKQWGLIKGLIRTSHRWVAAATVILLGATGGLVFSGKVLPELSLLMIGLVALLIPLTSFLQIRVSILRGLYKVILADIPEMLLRPLFMLLLVGSVCLLFGQANAAQALIMQLIAVFSAFVLGTIFLHSHIPKAVIDASPEIRGRAWAREVQPFFWIAIVGLLENQVGLYFLGYFVGLEPVGLFQVASQLVSLISMGLVAVNMPLQPKLAAAWAVGNKEEVQRSVAEAARLGIVVAVAGAIVLVPFAEIITSLLYGNDYVGGANVLRVLILGQLINAASGPCGLVLATTGRQWLALYGIAVALLTNTVANVILIPHYAAVGAALAVTMGLFVWNGLLVYFAWNRVNILTSVFNLMQIKKGFCK